MTASLLRPPTQLTTPPHRNPWPRLWSDQRRLLERQHDRIEQQLITLIQWHRPEALAWSPEEAAACDHAARILVENLKLHLRLEERWLDSWGCFCHGHRLAHRHASAAAQEGWLGCGRDRDRRLAWLEGLRTWFVAHRDGADARDYSLAQVACQQPSVRP
jgi:hemerythrin